MSTLQARVQTPWRRLALVVSLGVVVGCSPTTVNPGQAGIWFRPYQSSQSSAIVGEGRYWHWWWNDLIVYDLRWQSSLQTVEAQTKDKIHLSVKITVTARPVRDQLGALHRGVGRKYMEVLIQPLLHREIREHLAMLNHDEVGEQTTEMQSSLTTEMSGQLAAAGIEVGFVGIDDIDYPIELRDAIEARTIVLQRTRNAEAEQALAERQAQTAQVVAERQAAAVLAKVRSDAESRLAAQEGELRIAGKEAEVELVRARTAADVVKLRVGVLSVAYLKLRALEATEALATSPNTKVYVLPADRAGAPFLHFGPVE